MPLFITTGRFTPDAVKGMLAKPEDRAESVRSCSNSQEASFLATT